MKRLMIAAAMLSVGVSPAFAASALKVDTTKNCSFVIKLRPDLAPKQVVTLYGRRFSIEENFRDTKDQHFGLGLSATHVGEPARRDRLLLIAALAQVLLTVLGAAGESLGMDRMMKANTVKHRTHSLFRQGLHYYRSIPAMPEHRLRPLIERFAQLVREQQVCVEIFGII